MKKVLFSVALATVMLWSSSAAAATITFAEVVQVDDLIEGVNIGDSDAAEEAYLESKLGPITYTKVDVGGSGWLEVTGEPSGNLYAFDFSAFVTNPTAFLVKLGNATYSHYFYTNLNSLRYGVIDLNEITAAKGTITITSVSHSGTAGGGTPVPEPASLALLLLGVAGATTAGRRGLVRS